MRVLKRDGSFEDVQFDKIKKRIKDLSNGLRVDIDSIAQKAIERLYDGIKTKDFDEYLANIAVNYNVHTHYSILAGRICVSSHHKNTAINQLGEGEKRKISKLLKNSKLEDNDVLMIKLKNSLYDDKKREELISKYEQTKKLSDKEIDYLVSTPRFYYYVKTLVEQGTLSKEILNITIKHRDEIEGAINYENDYMYDYFGFKTLEKSYLLKKYDIISVKSGELNKSGEEQLIQKKVYTIIERPQDLLMRVAIAINKNNIKKAIELYNMMSEGYYTHATPTLFNAGTNKPQLSSCFLLTMKEDSINGIYDTLKSCALISQSAGGIGVAIHNIRSKGSFIKGTNGTSNGIVPMLKVFNDTARYVDQGGGKRKGSFAVYLEPWHADVRDFIQLKRKTGSEDTRARDLFLALWVPRLFWKRVQSDGKWSLFDPNIAIGLSDTYGDEFEKLYEKYEADGLAVDVISAREFAQDIWEVQGETGVPYMLNKDECNEKSNQKNLGVIKSSNLCTEVVEYTAPDEIAICNLASIALPKFVVIKDGKMIIDHEKLHEVSKIATQNLNNVIDVNLYVLEDSKKSNLKHRPIGLGVQGLADVFFKMRIPYDSIEAQRINEEIFETIYHGALEASMELSKKDGPYETINFNGGAPISKGILQFDMWNKEPASKRLQTHRYDWEKLRKDIIKYGVRNSLLLAPMPTASTSQILGNSEAFEPLSSNLYKRDTLSGEFTLCNKYMISHLEELGLWGRDVYEHMVNNLGSIATYSAIPQEIRDIYKTVFEISLKKQIDMAADRGAYICQSQSFNINIAKPTMERMKDIYLYGNKVGLKTMSYYVRTLSAGENVKVTVSRSPTGDIVENQDDENCTVCSS